MKILGISGSLRKNAYNTLLLKAASRLIDSDVIFDLSDISRIPFYNEDIDGESKPSSVRELLDSVSNADGLIFATPEYNHSISGVLKNAIDWASRPAFRSVLAGKPAGIFSAATGPIGGARAQMHLRDILSSTLTLVYPAPDYLLSSAQNAFDEAGNLIDETAQRRLKRFVNGYVQWLAKVQEAR